jgi:hypothetical protein
MQAIIELIGRPRAGKTTLANILGDELSPASVLYIDASPDQRLTTMMAPESPQLTLGRLFSQQTDATGSREAVDWVFSDLTVAVGEENELITVGSLPDEIDLVAREKLRYGLNRLAETYDYVIIDGHHPLLHNLLPDERLRSLEILTPEGFSSWVPPQEGELLHTPSLILNRYGEDPLPKPLDDAITHHQVRLIGKLPAYPTVEDCIRKLPDDFRNCLLKLDIPLNLKP